MATVIGVLNQKGGVGKTTLSINLSAELARRGKSVLLVDGDPQASAQRWAEERWTHGDRKNLFSVVGMARKSLHQDLLPLKGNFDFVIIDGAPRTASLTRSAMLASDFVLVPIQPSPYDVWASEDIVRLLEEVKDYKPNIKSAFVINRKIPHTTIGRDVKDVLDEVGEIPLLKSTICQRVLFAQTGTGSAIFEVPKGKIGALEIEHLTTEILELIGEDNG